MAAVEPGVSLAHEPPFSLGCLLVRPPTREVVAPGGRCETLEPRVMQVLVALHRAEGGILSRDDLIRLCWDGRIVGEDAITRVMSRLRRLSEGCGAGAFRIETITKVGYRLLAPEGGAEPEAPLATTPAAAAAPPPLPSRRALVVGGAAAGGGALAAGGAWLALRDPGPDRATRTLYQQGWTALANISPEQTEQAVGLFRAVVEAAPRYADGWGSLAYAYSCLGCMFGPDLRGSRERAQASAARALQLEPDNALAGATLAELGGTYGRWAAAEAAFRSAADRHPRSGPLIDGYKWVLFSAGRSTEAARLGDLAMQVSPPSPRLLYQRVQELEAAGRLVEADETSARMIALFPRNIPVWFTHFYHLMRNGHPAEALAFAMNAAGRPLGAPDSNFDSAVAEARAAVTRAPADIDRAVEIHLAAARLGAGYAENALLFGAMMGRLDRAFEVADAYYFGRGFSPPSLSFSPQQHQHYLERRTHFLFWPCCAAMRADARFDRLTREIGLKDYWSRSGRPPDCLTVHA